MEKNECINNEVLIMSKEIGLSFNDSIDYNSALDKIKQLLDDKKNCYINVFTIPTFLNKNKKKVKYAYIIQYISNGVFFDNEIKSKLQYGTYYEALSHGIYEAEKQFFYEK